MTPTNPKNAVIYCRVSTREQVEEGTSLTTQEKLCTEYAERQGYQVSEKFIEQGESAKTADRTELQRMLRFCTDRRNEVQVIIAYKLDRISRNTDDYSQLRLLLRRYGVQFRFTSEHYEDTPTGRFLENIIANVAQFDNDVRTERSVAGMKEAMREGRYVWKASFGYSNVRVGGKATIAPNEKAPVVRRVFERVAAHHTSLEEIRCQMIQEGLTDVQGRPLSRTHFYVLIRNPVYAGWIDKFGERHRGSFAPVVSEALFAQVQRVLAAGGKPNRQYRVAHTDFPLRRFVTTPGGRKLTGSWATGRTKRYPYYLARSPARCIRKERLEAAFVQLLDAHALDEKHFAELKSFVRRRVDRVMQDRIETRKALEAQVRAFSEKQVALLDKNLKGIISDTLLARQLQLIEEELREVQARLYGLPEDPLNYERALAYAEAFFVRPGAVWQQAGLADKIRLQWFYFPEGLQLLEGKSKTAEITFGFNPASLFWAQLSAKVTLSDKMSNTAKPPNPLVRQDGSLPPGAPACGKKAHLSTGDPMGEGAASLARAIEGVARLQGDWEGGRLPKRAG